jgi:PTS system glucitol/sorbitol-specific IIC component
MAEYRSIRVEKGPGGFGGPLVITPTEQRNKVMYITGGGAEPECLKKIVELTGLTPVNGFKTNCPEEELALVIIDCGGTLRCGIYPKKGIPTINVMPVGKSGPMAQFIKEDIYVSAVGPNQVSLAGGSQPAAGRQEKETAEPVKFNADMKVSETLARQENKSFVTKVGLAAGKVVNTFYQAARDAIQTCITTLLPFVCLHADWHYQRLGLRRRVRVRPDPAGRQYLRPGCAWPDLLDSRPVGAARPRRGHCADYRHAGRR